MAGDEHGCHASRDTLFVLRLDASDAHYTYKKPCYMLDA